MKKISYQLYTAIALAILIVAVICFNAGAQTHNENFEVFQENGKISDTTVIIKDLKKDTRINQLLYNDSRIQPAPVDLSIFQKIQVGTNNPGAKLWLTVICDNYKDKLQAISSTAALYQQFLATYPISKYANQFNCFAIWYAPVNSGVKHPVTATDCLNAYPQVPLSDSTTLLLSQFDYGGIHRLLFTADGTNLNTIYTYFGAQTGLKVVNIGTSYYGGSGGSYSCFAGLNGASSEIFIHEFGHSFAGLADEYCSGNICNTVADRINATTATTLAAAPWAPVPGAGLIVGANYCCSGLWKRAFNNCKMNTLGVPFCTVCANAIEAKILSLIGTVTPQPPIVTATYNNGTLTAAGASTYTWSPSSGLSATTGATVSVTTVTYTVVGTATNGLTASATVSPSAPVSTSPYREKWISMSVPTSVKTGTSITVSVTVQNYGTQKWNDLIPNGSNADINLGVKWDGDSDYNTLYRVNANNLTSGATATYTFAIPAPTTTGTNHLSFNIVREQICWFQNCDAANTIYTSPAITINP